MKLTNADAFPNSTSFPQPLVTPDLDPETQTADHRQGGGGARRNQELGPNPFVLKILTSKPLGLKILQTIFANPAPVAAFREGDGGGVPFKSGDFPEWARRKGARQGASPEIFSGGFVTMKKQASVNPLCP
jgi:hypothetical protein